MAHRLDLPARQARDRKIAGLHAAGYDSASIGLRFGLSANQVYRIAKRVKDMDNISERRGV